VAEVAEFVLEFECVACEWKGPFHRWEAHEATLQHTRAVLVAAEAAVAEARLKYEESLRG
jgi:hypothetical protein